MPDKPESMHSAEHQEILPQFLQRSFESLAETALSDQAEGVINSEEETTLGKYERKELNPENIIVTEAGMVAGDPTKLWLSDRPKISLKDRIFSGEVTAGGVKEALKGIRNYIVRASRAGRTRCVDGRPIEGYDENREAMKDRDLGPQVAGGTAGAAVCFRLAAGPVNDTFKDTSFESDFEEFASEIQLLGFELGVHEDDHSAHRENATGCGAIDRMPEIIDAMSNRRYGTRVKELTKAVLGEMYDTKIYSEMLGNALLLESESEDYFKNYKLTLFEKVKGMAKDAIERLIGNHNEVAVTVNRIYGTTFHRDEFSADNEHKIQAFNYDFWNSVELMEKLVRESERFNDMSDKRKFFEAQKLLTARVMYTVATLVTLTDGSLDLIVLDEKDDNGNVVDLFASLKQLEEAA